MGKTAQHRIGKPLWPDGPDAAADDADNDNDNDGEGDDDHLCVCEMIGERERGRQSTWLFLRAESLTWCHRHRAELGTFGIFEFLSQIKNYFLHFLSS